PTKILPCALCRPLIVTMIRAAEAGPAQNIEPARIDAKAKAKDRARRRIRGFAPSIKNGDLATVPPSTAALPAAFAHARAVVAAMNISGSGHRFVSKMAIN